MDYELRRVNNLKLAFDARQPGSGGDGVRAGAPEPQPRAIGRAGMRDACLQG